MERILGELMDANTLKEHAMHSAAAAYNVYFAYYHDAMPWDSLSQEMKNVWAKIAAAGRDEWEKGKVWERPKIAVIAGR